MAFLVSFSCGGSTTAVAAATASTPSPFPVVSSFISYFLGKQERRKFCTGSFGFFSCFHAFLRYFIRRPAVRLPLSVSRFPRRPRECLRRLRGGCVAQGKTCA